MIGYWDEEEKSMRFYLSVDELNHYLCLRVARGGAWQIYKAEIRPAAEEHKGGDRRVEFASALESLADELRRSDGVPLVMLFAPGSMPWSSVIEGTKEFEEYRSTRREINAQGQKA